MVRQAQRFLISGCSGGGKSTLIRALAARGYKVVDEPGLRIVRGETNPLSPFLPWNNMEKFAARALEVAISDFNKLTQVDQTVFFDRGIVDAAVALRHSSGAKEFGASTTRFRYGSPVFIAPPWEDIFSQNAERRHSFGDALEECGRLIAAYEHLGYETAILPKVSVAQRVAFVEETARAVMSEANK
ncbi:MAG: AAA family ATPase [Pseudomonadota bacterium]